MSEARELADRMTEAFVEADFETLSEIYAPDVIATTPELGELKGRDDLLEYLRNFTDSFSDRSYQLVAKHDAGDVAVDEGYFAGTNTGPLPDPSGDMIPATGKKIRVRTCDVVTALGGKITAHRFYYDQTEFLQQLGLLDEPGAPAMPVFARCNTMQFPPDKVEQAIRMVRERILPAAREIPGFEGMLSVVNRDSGTGLTVTLWESEAARADSVERAAALRKEAQHELQGTIVSVDNYEVVLRAL